MIRLSAFSGVSGYVSRGACSFVFGVFSIGKCGDGTRRPCPSWDLTPLGHSIKVILLIGRAKKNCIRLRRGGTEIDNFEQMPAVEVIVDC